MGPKRTAFLRCLVMSLGVGLAATAAAAADVTRDAVIDLEPAQIAGTSDGDNPGKVWTAILDFPEPVTVSAGDTLRGTVGFGPELLRIRDDGGGFFRVGMTTGLEQLVVLATMNGTPAQTTQEDNTVRLADARGPVVQLGATRVGGVHHNGMFAQVVTNVVGTGGEVALSGLTYRLGLVSGGPFTFTSITLRVLAEDIDITTRPPGDLAARACITGERSSGPGFTDACTAIPSLTADGGDSGLDSPRAVVVTADGTSLYVAAALDHAVARFDRDPATGALVYRACLTGETDSTPACTAIAGATPTGEGSPLDLVGALAASADGTSLYAASPASDAIVRFDRDRETGAILFADCITGELPGLGAVCSPIPDAASSGSESGLDRPYAITVSGDGRSLYAVALNDDAVAHFDRDPATGELAYRGCITGEAESGPAGTNACEAIATATSDGAGSGLDAPAALALSADDASLYVAAGGDDAVARFDRDPATGTLTYRGCSTGRLDLDACEPIPSATTDAADSGLDDVSALAVSSDGTSLYAVARGDDAVVRFTRDASGALAYAGCITGERESGAMGTKACADAPSATSGGMGSGLDGLGSLAVAEDGASVYAVSAADDAIARFDREPTIGALSFAGCLTGERGTLVPGACDRIGSAQSSGTHSGFDFPQAMAMSADGLSVYAVSGSDAAVAHFDRLPPPPVVTTTTTTTTTSSSTTTSSVSTTTNPTSTTTSTTLAVTPIGAVQLVIADHPDATKRKIVFVSSDPRIVPRVPTVEDGIDPTGDGAFLQVYNAAGGDDDACLALPASRWEARIKRSRATLKYADPQADHGPCKTALVKRGKLAITCMAKRAPIDYSLDEAAQQRVGVRFRSGTTEYCAVFGGTVVKDIAGRKFVAKGAGTPVACPTPPSACP